MQLKYWGQYLKCPSQAALTSMQVRDVMGDNHAPLCKFWGFYGGDCADILFWVLMLCCFGTLYWHFIPVITFGPVPSTLKMEAACAFKMSESTCNITEHKSWKHAVWFMKFLKWQPYVNYMFPKNTTAIVNVCKKRATILVYRQQHQDCLFSFDLWTCPMLISGTQGWVSLHWIWTVRLLKHLQYTVVVLQQC